MGKAKPEIPRWRRKPPPPAGPVITVKGRGARQIARDLRTTLPEGQHDVKQGVLARSGAYRFRRHLVPVWLLLGILAAGLGCHALRSGKAEGIGIAAGLLFAAALWKLTRHLKGFTRKAGTWMAALVAIWVPVLSALGPVHPLLVVLFASWLCLMWAWARHYRWRPDEKTAEPPPADQEIWERLAAKRKWTGHLDGFRRLEGGGRQWDIVLDGSQTHIGQVMSDSRALAAAWSKSVTEAYAEPSPTDNEARGMLTILPRNTLEAPRQWNGNGPDPETGLAVVGRFPDGKPVHERYFIRMSGPRHTIIAGADGSGKTGMIDMGLSIAAASGIIAPVILDPQEGQALPAWQEHVIYARGAEECLHRIRGLHEALFDRSRYLAGLRWELDGDWRKGMGFFDPFLTGLPIVEITLDEASALLCHPKFGGEASEKLADIAKLARKTGFRIRMAIHVPSLAELGNGGQPLRSILVGGNVFCGRTGDKVTQGMINTGADPSELPKYFPDGKPTVGLGYSSGPDNRPSTRSRWDYVPDPYKVARKAKIRGLDERCAEAMDRGMRGLVGVQTVIPLSTAPLAAAPDVQPGRSCADAILAVLHDEMPKGDIMAAANKLAMETWGRKSGYTIRSFTDALGTLSSENRITKVSHGTYAPVRASLHAVQGNGHTAETVSAR